MFDIAEARRSLLSQRTELITERDANMKLQQRFQQIASQLKTTPAGTSNNKNEENEPAEEDDDNNLQSFEEYMHNKEKNTNKDDSEKK
jgi:hypothetical protein